MKRLEHSLHYENVLLFYIVYPGIIRIAGARILVDLINEERVDVAKVLEIGPTEKD